MVVAVSCSQGHLWKSPQNYHCTFKNPTPCPPMLRRGISLQEHCQKQWQCKGDVHESEKKQTFSIGLASGGSKGDF